MLYRGPMGGGAASGKLGAMVASHNSGGQYLRSRVTPTNTNTPQQQEVRNGVRTLSPQWATTLTDDERSAWEVYAENVKTKNKLGDAINLSGIAQFIRSNVSRIQAGLPIITAAPTVYDIGDAGTPGTLAIGANSSSGTLTFDPTSDWNVGGTITNALLYVSRPQNVGKRFFDGPYQLAATIQSGGTTGVSTFTIPFAAGPAASQRFFAKYRITRGDGRLSTPIQIDALPS